MNLETLTVINYMLDLLPQHIKVDAVDEEEYETIIRLSLVSKQTTYVTSFIVDAVTHDAIIQSTERQLRRAMQHPEDWQSLTGPESLDDFFWKSLKLLELQVDTADVLLCNGQANYHISYGNYSARITLDESDSLSVVRWLRQEKANVSYNKRLNNLWRPLVESNYPQNATWIFYCNGDDYTVDTFVDDGIYKLKPDLKLL